jgi:SAM-dependent methyltransferase
MLEISRREVLNLVNLERDYILAEARKPGAEQPKFSFENLSWYLGIARNWTLPALYELSRRQPCGEVLDVGAFYCLASGAASRLGWQATGVDLGPIPNYSGLSACGRPSVVCNILSDQLPFGDRSFDAIFFLEVLEHLVYSPAIAFREMERVLRPGGRLYLSTPNAAGVGRIRQLIMGKNNEPFPEDFLREDDPYEYKGRTYFKSGREHRLWTMAELERYLPQWGFRIVDRYFYNTTIDDPDYGSRSSQVFAAAKFWAQPLVSKIRLLGGGLFVVAEPAG